MMKYSQDVILVIVGSCPLSGFGTRFLFFGFVNRKETNRSRRLMNENSSFKVPIEMSGG
jgi:hypothetical protein